MSESLIFADFLFLVRDVSESLISLKSNERCERIAHFAHQKWAMWANRSVFDKKRAIQSNERIPSPE